MSINAISPVDGRYADNVRGLDVFFSEKALMKYRLKMEVEYFIALSQAKVFRNLTKAEQGKLRSWFEKFSDKEASAIKAIESTTRHDIKALEYFMKKKIDGTGMRKLKEYVHFGLTSEDVNNIAYSLAITDFLDSILVPWLRQLIAQLLELAEAHKKVAMLARTHGQPAVPTTVGKEISVYVSRLSRQLSLLKAHSCQAKLNGAVGNYNAAVSALPKVDWVKFSWQFITGLGLTPNLVTTQVESHDSWAELFGIMQRINNILLDLDKDMWHYISIEYFRQKADRGEVGSSTMPQKVNPIDFEDSDGNLGIANALFGHFISKLQHSRLQRDLSDSTVQRNIGVAFAHSVIAYAATSKGLKKLELNSYRIEQDLESHLEVLAEAIQTVLRREGLESAYERLKEFTRGKTLTLPALRLFIEKLPVSDKVRQELFRFTPQNYIGIADKLVDIAVKDARNVL